MFLLKDKSYDKKTAINEHWRESGESEEAGMGNESRTNVLSAAIPVSCINTTLDH